eukprot:3149399-Prymnesium_polylepis.1
MGRADVRWCGGSRVESWMPVSRHRREIGWRERERVEAGTVHAQGGAVSVLWAVCGARDAECYQGGRS